MYKISNKGIEEIDVNRNKQIYDGRKLVEEVIATFSHQHDMVININKPNGENDFSVIMDIKNSQKVMYQVEVKEKLHSAALVSLEKRFQDFSSNLLLITSYVTPGLAESLKSRKIQFIDTVGNAYVEAPGIYIFVNRQAKLPLIWSGKDKTSSLFQPSGLKVIFICLAEIINKQNSNRPIGLINNLKALAATAGVSLGSASNARSELLKQDYAIQSASNSFEIIQKDKLLRNWVNAYSERLSPKLLLGRYQVKNPEWWKDFKLNQNTQFWGGESAAAKLTNYLSPEIITVYVTENSNLLINKMGMQPMQDGTVEIRRVFWLSDNFHVRDCVHPLLVYADLLSEDDSRNFETAKLIYQSYLSHAIEST